MRLLRAWIEGFAALRGVRVRPIPPPAAVVALVGLLVALVAGTASAVELRDAELVAAGSPVPQDMTYTGRLVNDRGKALAGPVDLTLSIFDVDTGGVPLYSENHLGVPLDATGGFSVQLGLGSSPSGTFDAALFSDVDRWIEVVIDSEVLTPRQIIGSVPWALIAQQANEIVPDPNAPRFEDCGDGTVADHQTGLQWEKKTGSLIVPFVCEPAGGCPDPHDVNNFYEWSNTGVNPDGGAFTDFLARLNGEFAPNHLPVTGCLAGPDRCDWRLPTIGELRTILIGPEAAPGQATTCGGATCIDPDFASVGGPTASWIYWSASTFAGNPNNAWNALFYRGVVTASLKTSGFSVRAVRVGSCH